MYRVLSASLLTLTLAIPLGAVSTKYIVERVESNGFGNLSNEQAAQIRTLLIGKPYDPEQAGWFLEQVRGVLQDNGYFHALVDNPSILPLRTNEDPTPIVLSFALEVGSCFRAGKIEILGVDAPTASELRGLITLQTGDIFDVSKIRQGMEVIQKWYNSRGFINEVAAPDQYIDTVARTISIQLSIIPDACFHAGTIEVTGIDDATTAKLVRLIPLETGAIFDPNKMDEGVEAVKSWLATHGFPRALVKVHTAIDNTNKLASVRLLVDADPNPGKHT
jgi:outer membrane protein assembly factor BamA